MVNKYAGTCKECSQAVESGHGLVRLESGTWGTYHVHCAPIDRLDNMVRTELVSAAKEAFPNELGNKWLAFGNEAIKDAIRTHILPATFADAVVRRGRGRPPGSKNKPKVAPIAATEPTTASATATEPQVSMDTIAAMVRDAVAAMQPRALTVTVGTQTNTLDAVTHNMFPTVLTSLANGLQLYLYGPAGTGKSTIPEHVATALNIPFGAQSCSPTMPLSALVGFNDAHGKYNRTIFRDIYENGGVFLLDEVDNGHGGILAVLNSALSNGYMSFPDGMVKRHATFVLVCAANTIGNGATREYVGRNKLDEPFLNRFVKLYIDIDEAIEQSMVAPYGTVGAQWLAKVRRYRANADTHGLKVLITPRQALQGAVLLSAGISQESVENMTIFEGLAPDAVSKIKGGLK